MTMTTKSKVVSLIGETRAVYICTMIVYIYLYSDNVQQ